jgi:GH15 family glucan-1,4-alpha-glucosidase
MDELGELPHDAPPAEPGLATIGRTGEFSAYPPIADYGFLSDTEVTALVAPSGAVEWMCLPTMDGPSVFGAILDRSAGSFRFGPEDVDVPADRRYLPGTMVLETSWDCGQGWIFVRDCLVMGPWRHENPERTQHIRPPTDYDAEHILLRTVRCVQGAVQLAFDCEPVFGYGLRRAQWTRPDANYYQACARDEDGLTLTLTSDIRFGIEGPSARGRTLLREGDTRFCTLSWGRRKPPDTYEKAYKRLVWTAHHWQHWLARGNFPDHRWRAYLTRSALTLKGLSFSPTGAIAAAATTSLPETPRGERNWDYRFSWIRDATFALWGLYTLGFDWEANDYFAFIADLAERDGGELQIVYGIDGAADLTERTLDHLQGYQDACPVRIGNDAYRQRQNDVWGTMLESVYLHTKSRDRLDDRIWRVAKLQVEHALEHWREPDRGIWEVRGEPKHFTSSKVMCWVAADRGARLARLRDEHDLAQGGRRDPRRHLRPRPGRARRVLPALRHHRAGRLAAADAAAEVPAAGGPADQGHGAGHRRRAHPGRPGAALPGHRDRRRHGGGGGDVHHLHVLAGLRAGRDRRGAPRPRPVREGAVLRQPAAAVRRGDRPEVRPAPGQLPAGVHPPGPDQRGHARDQRRAGGPP